VEVRPEHTAIHEARTLRPPEVPGLQLEAEIGRGGFGVVWRARWEAPGGVEKVVAVKRLRPDLPESEEVARRMRDEARMLSRLRHRAIVRLEALLHLPEGPALVTEFVEGQDLREVLLRGPLPERVVAEILAEVASGLEAAHGGVSDGAGRIVPLVHRDIKPANLRLTRWGEVKLLDFGAARADIVDREAATRMMMLGTPDYLAPESEGGRPVPGSDLYALGIIAWECLTGERLGKLARSEALHGQQVSRALERLPAKAWATLVADLLEWEPGVRPNARALRERVEGLARAASGPSLREWAIAGLEGGGETTRSFEPAAATVAPPGQPSQRAWAPGAPRATTEAAPSPTRALIAPLEDPLQLPSPRPPTRLEEPHGRSTARPWWLFAAAGGLAGGLAATLVVALVAAAWLLLGS
jgi:serine/threonine protein kinase